MDNYPQMQGGYNMFDNAQTLQRLHAIQRQPYPSYMTQYKSCLKALPVTSMDEAKAAMIDLDGSLFIYVNLAKGEIYTKQYNFQTGYSDFQTYKLCQMQNEGFVSVGDFNNLQSKVDLILQELGVKGGTNDESNADNANATASR